MIPIKLIYLKHNPTIYTKKASHFKREPIKPMKDYGMVKFMTRGIFNRKEIDMHFEEFSHGLQIVPSV